jgi:Ca2+-binding RTX toxin-like protein
MATVTYSVVARRIPFDFDRGVFFGETTAPRVAFTFDAPATLVSVEVLNRDDVLPEVSLSPEPLSVTLAGRDVTADPAVDLAYLRGGQSFFEVADLLVLRERPADGTGIGAYTFVEVSLDAFGNPIDFASGEAYQAAIDAADPSDPWSEGAFLELDVFDLAVNFPFLIDLVEVTGDRFTEATEGNDVLFGDDRDDVIDGLCGGDDIFGLGGDDRLRGGPTGDELFGGAGDDTLEGGDGGFDAPRAAGDTLFGGPGDDLLSGGSLQGWLYGEEGNDTIFGGPDNDVIDGGPGDDELYAGGGSSHRVFGGEGADVMIGGHGRDDFWVDDPRDVVEGRGGVDTVYTTVSYTLPDGSGVEVLTGGRDVYGLDRPNADLRLQGSGADETIVGNAGDNILIGAGGTDRLEGRAGADVFVLADVGPDPIVVATDFALGQGDRIAIDDRLLGLGGDRVEARVATSADVAAVLEAGLVTYDRSGGGLVIDSDADGTPDAAIVIMGAPALTAEDVILF